MITGEGGISSFIHRFIPAQSAQASSGPTLLMLHGTGGDENALLDLGRMLAPGAALLSPRGKVLENGMPRYFRRLAEGVFDLSDLTRRTHELADFVETASVAYDFDPARVIAVGFSNGANIAASMLLLRPSVLSAAVLLHAQVPLVPPSLPNLLGKPVFMSAGRADPLIPANETERLAALLKQAGATVITYWHNGGHEVSHGEVSAAREWLTPLVGRGAA
jgi:phospholipase/carboxylesterase